MKKEAALFVAGFIFATGAAAQVYKCPDASGKTVVQQVPCTGGERMTVRPGSGFDRETQYKIDEEKQRRAAEKKRLEEAKMKQKWEEEYAKKREVEEQKKKELDELLKRAEERFYEKCEQAGITERTPLRIGMTKEQVSCVRGYKKPARVSTTQTAAGVREQVIYEPDWGATKYLYFDNGILTAIQD